MTSQQLEYFLSAAKHLNFTKAADEFYTSQPTISRQIALLEEELGFELFARNKGNLRLTVAGVLVVQEFSKAIKIIHDTKSKLELMSEGLEGDISIGYVRKMNTDLFVYPPTIDFTKQYPSIKVKMESMSFSGLRKGLETEEFDIIFTFDFELRTMQDVSHIKCCEVTGIIAMSASHPLAKKEDLIPSDFSGQTFLLPRPVESEIGRSDIVNLLKQLGIRDVTLQGMDGNESIMFGVRTGSGVALLDESMEIIFDSRYKFLKLPKEFSINIVAVWKADNHNPIVPLYIDLLQESSGSDEPSFPTSPKAT